MIACDKGEPGSGSSVRSFGSISTTVASTTYLNLFYRLNPETGILTSGKKQPEFCKVFIHHQFQEQINAINMFLPWRNPSETIYVLPAIHVWVRHTRASHQLTDCAHCHMAPTCQSKFKNSPFLRKHLKEACGMPQLFLTPTASLSALFIPVRLLPKVLASNH